MSNHLFRGNLIAESAEKFKEENHELLALLLRPAAQDSIERAFDSNNRVCSKNFGAVIDKVLQRIDDCKINAQPVELNALVSILQALFIGNRRGASFKMDRLAHVGPRRRSHSPQLSANFGRIDSR